MRPPKCGYPGDTTGYLYQVLRRSRRSRSRKTIETTTTSERIHFKNKNKNCAVDAKDGGIIRKMIFNIEKKKHLHEVALEEFFQLPLGCRIREVADVQSAALGSTGMDGIFVFVLTSDGGIAKSVGNVLDSVGNFLHGGGHLDQWLYVELGD